MPASLSIVIPVLNGRDLIAECLRSLEAQCAIGDEIIVVDNGSTDGTPDIVAREFPRIRLIQLPHNLGFAGGVNGGLEAAHGDAMILVNHDVVLREGCLKALSQRLEQSGPGIVGCKLLYPDGRTIQHAGGIIQYPRATPDHFGYRQIDNGQWDTLAEVDYVTGALFAIDRSVMCTIGLFDVGFYPIYYEEIDYCFRARAAGFPVLYEPAAVAIHWEAQTQNTRSLGYYRTMERGRLRFVLKNYRSEQLADFWKAESEFAASVPASFARDVLASAYFDTLRNVPNITPPTLSQDADRAIITHLCDLRLSVLRSTEAREDNMNDQLQPIQLPILHEHDFRSKVPIVGPLISLVRRGLYSLTVKWAMRVLIEQQNQVNAVIAQRLNEYDQRLSEFDARLLEQDRDLTHLVRSLAETQIQLRAQLRSSGSPVSGLETPGTPAPVSPRP